MMCGIAGFFNFKNSEKLVRAVNQIQRHRGPDYQGEWISDQAAFAHQRLSIIDLSELSNQPFEKNGLVIVFNGEIYNYQEIKRELESKYKVKFRTQGDTEVVLESYKTWGEDCLQRL